MIVHFLPIFCVCQVQMKKGAIIKDLIVVLLFIGTYRVIEA